MMKFTVFLFLFAANILIAQVPVPNENVEAVSAQDVNDENYIHNMAGIDSKPEFPGGLQTFYKFVANNFNMEFVPNGLSGKVFASFVIEKDGSVGDVKIHRDFGYGTGAEAIRVLKSSPKWTPGMHNGKNIRVRFSIPINLVKS